MILNLGCGTNKLNGAINIDSEPACKPDIHLNILEPLPYPENSVEKVYLFHTIEHIQKKHHKILFDNVWKVLEPAGKFILSYPEFHKCFINWSTNYRGMRDFWEATIFGRQLYPSDYHVCIMDSKELKNTLQECGFEVFPQIPESEDEDFNTITLARKATKPRTYEDIIKEDVDRLVNG